MKKTQMVGQAGKNGGTKASSLHLRLKNIGRKWRGVTVSSAKSAIDRTTLSGSAPDNILKKHFPDEGIITVRFSDNTAILEANFKICRNGHMVRPKTPVAVQGKCTLGIGGIAYAATVS